MKFRFAACCSLILLATTACGSAADDADATAAATPAAAVEEEPAPAAEPVAAVTPSPTPVAAPSPVAGYDWFFRVDENERSRPAVLGYEKSDTDDQAMNFVCEEGGQRIFAGIDGGSADLTAITLVSGEQALRLSGSVDSDEETGFAYFTTRQIPNESPLLASFAENGWLRLSADGHTRDLAGTAAGKRAIKDFIAHCNRAYSSAG